MPCLSSPFFSNPFFMSHAPDCWLLAAGCSLFVVATDHRCKHCPTNSDNAYVMHMWCICDAYVMHLWCICVAYVMHMWCICDAYVMHMWCKCYLTNTLPTPYQHLTKPFQHPTNTLPTPYRYPTDTLLTPKCGIFLFFRVKKWNVGNVPKQNFPKFQAEWSHVWGVDGRSKFITISILSLLLFAFSLATKGRRRLKTWQ